MHLPPPNLPRFGGGERPPFLCKPPAPLTITMGQRRAVFASPNTPRALLSVSNCPPIRAPFPPSGKGVGGFGAERRRWRMKRGGESVAVEKSSKRIVRRFFRAPQGGKGKCCRRLLWERFCAQYGLIFGLPSKINPYPAQPATGVLGQSPKRILPTFVRTKVGPRRAGVQTKFSKNLAPPEVIANFFTPPPKASAKPTPRRRAVLTKFPKILASPQTSKSPKKSQDEIGKKQQGIGKSHPFPAANVNFR